MSYTDAEIYRIIVASAVMPLLTVGVLAYFIYLYIKRKNQYELDLKDRQLREQQLIIERQEALHQERTRIAGEMHDDLGGGLTTIKYLSNKLTRKLDDDRLRRDVDKIATNATTLVSNMSEIIWAMNGGMDTVENLVAYCRRYAREYLEDYEVDLKFSAEGVDGSQPMTGEVRRNIFLVIKEALHNTIKHARASCITLSFRQTDNQLHILYSDDGIGLPEHTRTNGNGLQNMMNRISHIGGDLTYGGSPGLQLDIHLPMIDRTSTYPK